MRTLALLIPMLFVLAAVAPTAAAQGETDPNPANSEWMVTTLVIEQPSLTTLDIVGSISIRKYVVEGTPYKTADDLGDAYQQMKAADEYARSQGQESNRADQFVTDLESATKTALSDSLNASFPGATITVEDPILDRSTLGAPSGNPYTPGVLLEVEAQVVRTAEAVGLGELSTSAVGVVFNAGAKIGTTLTLSAAAGHDVTYILLPPADPAGLEFLEAGPAPAARLDGRNLVATIMNGAGTETATLDVKTTLANPNAPKFTEKEIADGVTVTATVDLKDIDIELGKAINGDMGNLLGSVSIRAQMTLLKLPPELKSALPENVELDYLTANTIRLLYKEGAISAAQIADLEKGFVDEARKNLANALQVPVEVKGGLAEGSITAAVTDASKPGAALDLVASADFAKPLSPPPAEGGAAIALYTQGQSFSLPRVQGYATTYTIILPKGLALTGLETNDNSHSQGTSDDGRDQFTVSPQGESSEATVQMAVTPSFVFAKFTGLVIGLVVLVLLIVGTPIALVAMRRGKK